MRGTLAVIGARLRSSRLPRKQLLPLAGRPLIERIFQRLRRVEEIDVAVLATTSHEENQDLIAWARSTGNGCFAYDGDENDVLGRVDAVVQAENPERVVYICGDCPLLDPATLSSMIQALIRSPQADRAQLKPSPKGPYVHEGFDVYSRHGWAALMRVSREASFREHVGSGFAELGDRACIAWVCGDPRHAGLNHRISVDTWADYQFMSEVHDRWYAEHAPSTVVDLGWVMERLGFDEDLRAINAHVRQRKARESAMKAILMTGARAAWGMGHLRRSQQVGAALMEVAGAGVELWVMGDKASRISQSSAINTRYLERPSVVHAVRNFSDSRAPDVLILDFPKQLIRAEDMQTIRARWRHTMVVSMDGTLPPDAPVDLHYFPSPWLDPAYEEVAAARRLHGWECIILGSNEGRWTQGERHGVLVCSGGADPENWNNSLPAALDGILPSGIDVCWVQGPFSDSPNLSGTDARRRWDVLTNVEQLMPHFRSCGVALLRHGLVFYEALHAGCACVAWLPPSISAAEEAVLRGQDAALLTRDLASALEGVRRLITDSVARCAMGARAAGLVDGQGARRLASRLLESMCK